MNNAFLIRALLMGMLSVGLVGCQNLFTGPTQNQGTVGEGLIVVSVGSAMGQNVSGRSQANFLEPGASYVIEANNTEAIRGNQSVVAPAQPSFCSGPEGLDFTNC